MNVVDSEFKTHEDERLPTEFLLRIRAQLKAALEKRELHWGELVRECNGAYPRDVHKELCWLIDNREVVGESDSVYRLASRPRIRSQCAGVLQEAHSAYQSLLPEPHPLDFDWRFTQQAIDTLVRQIESLPSHNNEVALLGAPTLFVALATRGLNVWLFDKNADLLQGLRNAGYKKLVHHNLFGRAPNHRKFGIVVADPPWYLEHYHAFVRTAGVLLRSGGHLLLSVLPKLTRPSAVVDRAALSDLAAQYGFVETARTEKALLYECPPFEVAALERQALYCGPWRFGDLVLYQLPLENGEVEYLPLQMGDSTVWRTFRIDRLIVKVRCRQREDGKAFDFRPVSADGRATLDTVSRRYPLRPLIDLWTSRNSAFTVSRIEILLELLDFMERGSTDPLNAVRRVHPVNDAEATKMGNLIDWLTKESIS